MKISILTIFPALFDSFIKTSIIERATKQKIISFNIYNLLNTVATKIRVDAHTVGPGPGMVIKPEVIDRGITECEEMFGLGVRIFFSPQGSVLTQTLLRNLLNNKLSILGKKRKNSQNKNNLAHDELHLILICLRYEGTDYRVETEFADLSLSIGDYVLMGGELPAQVFLEGLIRLIPGVLGNEASSTEDSFETPFFDHPSYCKPDIWKQQELPAILLSGNHAEINNWRLLQAAKKTLLQRFDWFRKHSKALDFINIAQKLIPAHYCVIMHDKVLNKEGLIGTTSIKSMDLHDIARSANSYGIKRFFVVQPLKDQQEIAREFFSFWTGNAGQQQHSTRCDAVEKIDICDSLEQVLEKIKIIEGQEALLIATSAQNNTNPDITNITYNDQKTVWELQRPVLFVFGTGYGLARQIINKCNFILTPIKGLTHYNHLSVRAAAAIIFDRWLGINPAS